MAERREARRLRARGHQVSPPAQFFFDLACPFTYLAAERVERSFDAVVWTPTSAAAVCRTSPASDPLAEEAVRCIAERRAAALRMPLSWPDRFPAEVPAAMRAAGYAVEQGRGAAFVLAAGRLAYCGGFDLEDPEILAEAAAAAGVGLDECLRAAGDCSRDEPMEAAGRRLLAAGADRLPALRVGRALFWGEERAADAAWAARFAAQAAN